MLLHERLKIFKTLNIVICHILLINLTAFAWLPKNKKDTELLVNLSKEFTNINTSPRLLCKYEIQTYISKTLEKLHRMDIDENLKKDTNLMKTIIKIYLIAEYLDIMTGWFYEKAGQELIKYAKIWKPEETLKNLLIWWKYEPSFFYRGRGFFNSICYNNVCEIIGSDTYMWRQFGK